MNSFLDQLNDSQRAAVEYIDGPSLVIAGAGSGKTRVLTYKVVYLLQQGLKPYNILALTFTNKAAREMKERIAQLVGEEVARNIWMGTFHSIFSKILRFEATLLGYKSNFTIYDAADSKSLIKAIMKELKVDDNVYRVGTVQSRISMAKNSLITSTAYASNTKLMQIDIDSKMPLIRDIYERYQSRCFQANAMDFDDLLLQTNILFRDHPEVLEKYSRKFRFVLVDEYQDTNFAQHLIVQRLCEKEGHICAVGDDAQSIYSFRGANIDNILNFRNLYKDCRIFKLERNYRSTQNIVNAANCLIEKNRNQIHKSVFSEKEVGNKLELLSFASDYEEAYAVASRISSMRGAHGSYSDFAILYRTNAQSRLLEEALRKRMIPYRIYGGMSFYQRKEIKDAIAYFRLVINPDDEEAFKRIVNFPARGIGQTSLQKLIDAATTHHVSIHTVIDDLMQHDVKVNSGMTRKLNDFREMIGQFIVWDETMAADELAKEVMEKSGIVKLLAEDHSVEGVSKMENLTELLKGISEFCEIRREEGSDQIRLQDYLAEVALLTDQDNTGDEQKDKVTLMTVHSAKGLEFRNVFVVGMEENLFPSAMSMDSARAVEEERRLFYVAITRAEQTCTLSYANSRFRNGRTDMCSPSRFLRDIDPVYLKANTSRNADPFDTPRRYPGDSSQWGFMQRTEPAEPAPAKQPATASPTPARSERSGSMTRIAKPQEKLETVQNLNGYSVGMRIEHGRFGRGVIQSLEGSGKDARASILFDNFGSKTLLLAYAKLNIL